MGGERNILRVPPRSWLKPASVRHRSIAVRALASSLMSAEGSPVPPDARLNVTVGFIGGYKYFIRIVLPKARQIHQQAVQVRHRHLDLVYFRDARKNSLAHRIERVLYRLAIVPGKHCQQDFTDFGSQHWEGQVIGAVIPVGAKGCAKQAIGRGGQSCERILYIA